MGLGRALAALLETALLRFCFGAAIFSLVFPVLSCARLVCSGVLCSDFNEKISSDPCLCFASDSCFFVIYSGPSPLLPSFPLLLIFRLDCFLPLFRFQCKRALALQFFFYHFTFGMNSTKLLHLTLRPWKQNYLRQIDCIIEVAPKY